jgi:hypothetical protein
MKTKKTFRKKVMAWIAEFYFSLIPVIRNRYLYLGILSLISGLGLNLASQTYLHNYMSEGKTLPMLSDLILDHLPHYDVSIMYDLFCMIPVILVVLYIIHRKDYNRIPFFLVLSGIFYVIRGAFIVLTPFGNPPMFSGSDTLFNGFSHYELGVYPSGHTGHAFLMYLLVNDRKYRRIIMVCLVIVIAALFISHGHYSIDILSGLLFSYAIRSFGERHMAMFVIGEEKLYSKKKSVREYKASA